jgi:hypothetical protein
MHDSNRILPEAMTEQGIFRPILIFQLGSSRNKLINQSARTVSGFSF